MVPDAIALLRISLPPSRLLPSLFPPPFCSLPLEPSPPIASCPSPPPVAGAQPGHGLMQVLYGAKHDLGIEEVGKARDEVGLDGQLLVEERELPGAARAPAR